MKVHEVLKDLFKVYYEMSYIHVLIRWRLRSDGHPRQTRWRRGRNRSPRDRVLWCLQPLENPGNVGERKKGKQIRWTHSLNCHMQARKNGEGGGAINSIKWIAFLYTIQKCPLLITFHLGQLLLNYAMCLKYYVNLNCLTTKSYTVKLNQKLMWLHST